MNTTVPKRLTKDLQIIHKNKTELNERGIYVYVDDRNLTNFFVLVVPRHKQEGTLVSPYTYGFFMFEFNIPSDFPMSPPQVQFHPKQNHTRLHPNYYQNGKVCLSVINTWASQDWTPSTSLYSLINILEERFNENALCFEPGRELANNETKDMYNKYVEYGKYLCVSNIAKSQLFSYFSNEIRYEFTKNKDWLRQRLNDIICENKNCLKAHVKAPYTTGITVLDYEKLRTLFDNIVL